MGAESTIHITREDAIAAIIEKLAFASNEEIENIAHELKIAGCLYNYSIVTEYLKCNNWSNFRQAD